MIDWDRLTELRTEIGEDDFREVAELFVEEITDTMARLSAVPGTATEADFHFLRGSAGNLGLSGFAEGCAVAERAVGAGHAPDIDALAGLLATSLASAAGVLPASTRAA